MRRYIQSRRGSAESTPTGRTLASMVDPSPADRASPSDPNEDAEHADQDERWIEMVAALEARFDPVPDAVREAARRALEARRAAQPRDDAEPDAPADQD